MAARLPYAARMIHARWSGEACWIATGDLLAGLPKENVTDRPAPGQVLFYGGGTSEPEILIPYGETRFACVSGSLDGNHLITVEDDAERLAAIGRATLWNGARDIRFAWA